MAHQLLIVWAEKQLDWVKDALRRHALANNFQLGEENKNEVLRRLRSAAGIVDDQPCEHTPFTNDDLKGSVTTASRTLLSSLGPVKNLARIAPDQTLRFALDGITLIYGDNGTGKTGYCRITKKLCRSSTTEALLGNVFMDGDKLPAEIDIGHILEGAEKPTIETWTDGTSPPASIASISVFDSRNGRLYVDDENRIGFLPSEVALLEQFAKHCAEMNRKIDSELRALNIRIKVPLPGGYSTNGDVTELLNRLNPKKDLPTKAEVEASAAWTAKDELELKMLEKLLAEDPQALADRLRRGVSLLEGYVSEAETIDVGLAKENLEKLVGLFTDVKEKKEAATIAATEKFKDEPIKGTGLQPWRLMYQYAEAYAKSEGHDHIPSKDGDRCRLCQEPLSADGAARMQRFAEFIDDTATKASDAAMADLQKEISAFQKLTVPKKKDIENALADFRKFGGDQEDLAAQIVEYFEKAESRRTALLTALETGQFEGVPQCAESIIEIAIQQIEELGERAGQYEKDAKEGDAKWAQDRKKLSALRDSKKLSDDLPTILARLDDLWMSEKLSKCVELLNTRSVSTQITALRRELVTADLELRIKKEIKTLDLLHLPFRVSDRSAAGQSNFRVILDTPASVANDEILSEGEQKALALACFFGELGADEEKHGIIIDDPVSSLDHIRIRRVAERIVQEAAKGKQVAVFTHNLLFYNEMIEAAARINPQIPIAVRVITKSEEAGFGLISETDEPWIAQKVGERMKRLSEKLKKLKARVDYGTDVYRGASKDFYTDLRETWERLVEEMLLGSVVERFNTDVKTQSLKGVVVEDEDYKKLFFAMRRASERSGHDMPAGKNAPMPKPEDMEHDLKELDEYRSQIKKRFKETQEKRKALEMPPAAKVA